MFAMKRLRASSGLVGGVLLVLGSVTTPVAAQTRESDAARSSGSPAVAREASPLADFNGDGNHDLAVGVPYEEVSEEIEAGGVHVIYGSDNGLNGDSPIDDQFWTQGSPGISGSPEESDRFGLALAWGDFDGDGFDDLAIGVPFEDATISTGNKVDAGVVHIIYGSGGGLSARDNFVFSQNYPGVDDEVEPGDQFGASLAAANFGKGPRTDLAVGAPLEDVEGVQDAGAVNVIYGDDSWVAVEKDQLWHQGIFSIEGITEHNDQFGYALAGADFGRSNHKDLAIGVPREDLDPATQANAGAVNVIYGAENGSGLNAANDQLWHQDSSGIGGGAESDDRFGYSLEAANFGHTSHLDLAVGVPYEDVGTTVDAGSVNVLYGAAEGLGSASNQLWHLDSRGIAGNPGEQDRLGWAVGGANFGKSDEADLAIGIPYDDPDNTNAGSVLVIYGDNDGLLAAESEIWTQDTCVSGQGCVEGGTENADHFGSALAGANFGKSDEADLAIGVPEESYERSGGLDFPNEVGAVNVIYGSSSGLTVTGDQFWWQRSDTLGDAGDNVERFGAPLA